MNYRMGTQTSLTEIAANQSSLSIFEIDRLTDIIKSEKQETALVGEGSGNDDSSARVSEVVWMTQEFLSKYRCHDLASKILETANFMNDTFFQFDLLDMENPQLTKYDSANRGFYKPHMDCGPLQTGWGRKMSMVIQLSDPNDYEGGDFEYFDLKSAEWISLRQKHPEFMEKGMALAFPSFVPHGVRPVTKGIRYSLVTWCNGPRFK